jgi:hypothetical protein
VGWDAIAAIGTCLGAAATVAVCWVSLYQTRLAYSDRLAMKGTICVAIENGTCVTTGLVLEVRSLSRFDISVAQFAWSYRTLSGRRQSVYGWSSVIPDGVDQGQLYVVPPSRAVELKFERVDFPKRLTKSHLAALIAAYTLRPEARLVSRATIRGQRLSRLNSSKDLVSAIRELAQDGDGPQPGEEKHPYFR